MGACTSSEKKPQEAAKSSPVQKVDAKAKDTKAKAEATGKQAEVPNPPATTMVLYGHELSQPCRSVQWFIEYAKLQSSIEVKMVDLMKGAQKEPQFVEKFPEGKVPAFQDGDFCFAESTAILKYIAEGTDMLPTDKKQLARVNEYMGRHGTTTRKFSSEFIFPYLFATPESKEAKVEAGRAIILPILKSFDDLLGKQKYILGDSLTLADFLFAPEVDQLEAIVGEENILVPYTNIKEYLARLRDLTGYASSIDTAAAILKELTKKSEKEEAKTEEKKEEEEKKAVEEEKKEEEEKQVEEKAEEKQVEEKAEEKVEEKQVEEKVEEKQVEEKKEEEEKDVTPTPAGEATGESKEDAKEAAQTKEAPAQEPVQA